jgi:uridine phosphorylase
MGNLPPILEFDADQNAILNPNGRLVQLNGTDKAVACFFADVLEKQAADGKLEPVGYLGSEMGRLPVYRTIAANPQVLVYLAGQGAPFSAQLMEKMIASGVKKFIAVSGSGALIEELVPGDVVILQTAVRDEGTSYHYLAPSREIGASPAAVKAVSRVLRERDIPFRLAKTWSTDGYFRETAARHAARVREGCEVVEMEAAALYAVAQFRGVEIVQIAYTGDLVVPEKWDKRGWDERFEDRVGLLQIAIEALTNWQ